MEVRSYHVLFVVLLFSVDGKVKGCQNVVYKSAIFQFNCRIGNKFQSVTISIGLIGAKYENHEKSKSGKS